MKTLGSHSISKSFSGIRISLLIYFLLSVGVSLQLSAGPLDFWWHSQFGFDGLLSPPHSVLAVGMLMAALGALIGIYSHYSYLSDKINNTLSLLFSKLSLIVGFAVFLMVSVGVILMFTLPFSNGQYFDFNPNPFAALVAASIFIPFILGVCLFLAAKISTCSINNRIPFILSSIVAVIMIIQSTTTITSNSYFAWLFPLYLLNIIPAIVTDILILHLFDKRRDKVGARKSSIMNCYVAASVIVSIFYTTLFFPWTVDVYGGYYEPPDTLRTEQFLVQLMIPVVLPITVPISIVSSLAGGLVAQILMKTKKLSI